MAGELAAFARLGALRHLDLQIVAVDEILARHAEAGRRHLLDRAAAPIAVRIFLVARRVLAAFAGVRLRAEAIHGNRERFVRFLTDRPVRHCAGRKALDDRLDRLDLVDRNRRGHGLQLEEPAERRARAALIVDELRVLLEDRVLTASRGVLQLENGLRVEEMVLAVSPPLILAARIELRAAAGAPVERAAVSLDDFSGHDLDADAADA